MLAIVRRKATESDLRGNCIRGRRIGAQSCEGCQLTFRRRLCQPSGAKVEWSRCSMAGQPTNCRDSLGGKCTRSSEVGP